MPAAPAHDMNRIADSLRRKTYRRRVAFTRWPLATTLVSDGALAAIVGGVILVAGPGDTVQGVPSASITVAYLLAAGATLAVALRRVLPRTALVVTATALAAYLTAGFVFGPVGVPLLIMTYTVAAQLPLVRALVATTAALAILVAPVLVAADWSRWPRPVDLATDLAIRAVPLILACGLGTAARLVREAGDRARGEQTRIQAYEERLRIAQDVHDIIGHGLAAISMQAGVALHLFDRRPDEARTVLELIRTTSRESLDELRGTLAVLRRIDDADDRRPRPGMDGLDALVGRIEGSGLPVDLVRDGDPRRLPDSVDLVAYRIVQESLTNVLRHAGPATVLVRVSYRTDELTIRVADTGRGTPPRGAGGQGIAGMRTRARGLGGSLEAGPGPAGGFVVTATLPLREASR